MRCVMMRLNVLTTPRLNCCTTLRAYVLCQKEISFYFDLLQLLHLNFEITNMHDLLLLTT
jgi:hypothetical protein